MRKQRNCKCSGPKVGVYIRMRKESSVCNSMNWRMVGDKVGVVAGFLCKKADSTQLDHIGLFLADG